MKLREVDTLPMLMEMEHFLECATTHASHQSYLENGPLRHGLTLWLKHLHGDKLLEYGGEFQECWEFIKHFCWSNKRELGAAYIHRLSLGEVIDPHIDVEAYHFTVDRYQLYLNWPYGCGYAHESNDGTVGEGSLIKFNHHSEHNYWNHSSMNWYFMVVDLKK